VPRLDTKPGKSSLAKRLRLREEKQAAAVIRPQVVQVRVHGVRAAPEVNVVRKIDGGLVAVDLGNLQLQEKVAAHRMLLPVVLPDLRRGERQLLSAARMRARGREPRLLHFVVERARLVRLQAE
jgi:ribosomal protein L27